MEYYVIAVGLNALLSVFMFDIFFAVIAAIECFVLIFSYSFYVQSKNTSQEGVVIHSAYTTVNTVSKDENGPLTETNKHLTSVWVETKILRINVSLVMVQ